MKMYLFSIIFLLSIFVNCTSAQDTNNAFWPQESGRELWQTEKEAEELNAQARSAAFSSGECRPAESDPEGHWGPIVYGLTLSIRSKTNVFLAGSPLPIAVIIRNTTTNTTSVFGFSKGAETSFSLEDESGRILHPNAGGISCYGFKALSGKRQIKYEYDMFHLIHLQAGVYKIYAEQPVAQFLPNTQKIIGHTNLCSGTLTFRIVSN